MSAYVIVEFTVKDPDVYREKYAPNAGRTAKEYGGEALANSNWEILHGDGSLTSGALMRFPDHETVIKWYDSPEYQPKKWRRGRRFPSMTARRSKPRRRPSRALSAPNQTGLRPPRH